MEVISDLFKSIFSGVMGQKPAARELRRVKGGEVESEDQSFKKLASLLTACPTSKREKQQLGQKQRSQQPGAANS